jgi:hypothetical protein
MAHRDLVRPFTLFSADVDVSPRIFQAGVKFLFVVFILVAG